MRTAAHSCLMTRKSLGGARTTAATTELSASAVDDASDGASDAEALLPAPPPLCEDELRHNRVHFRPFPPPPPPGLSFSTAGLSPTSIWIHLLDAPIAASQSPNLTFPLRAEHHYPHNEAPRTKRPNGKESARGRGKRETWATCLGRCAGAVSKFETRDEQGAGKPGRRGVGPTLSGVSSTSRKLTCGPEERCAVTSLGASPSQQRRRHAAVGKATIAAAHALTFFPSSGFEKVRDIDCLSGFFLLEPERTGNSGMWTCPMDGPEMGT